MLGFSSPRTWIGIRGSPGEFQYSDGTPLTFSDWDNGQPTNWKPNKNCAIANKNNNRWKNIDCAQKFRFICEYVEPDRCIPDMSNLPPELRLKLCLSQANSCLKLFSDVCECLKSFANACQQIFNDVCQEVFNHGRPDDKNC